MGSHRPRKIAVPPPTGVGCLWIIRPPGCAISPSRGAIRITSSVPNSEIAIEAATSRIRNPIMSAWLSKP